MSSRLWIRNPLAVLADNADGGIVVEGNRIIELVPAGRQPVTTGPTDIFDANEHVLLPGLINTHHHFYQTLTRACPAALNKALFPWLQSLYPIWAGLTPRMLEAASRLAMVELLMSGCTTASDHHYVFPGGLEEAIDVQIEQARLLGIRAVLTRGSMSLSQDDGGLPPASTVQTADAILSDSERLIQRYHETDEGAMVQIALAPCSPFSVTEELMVSTAALARRFGVRLHTHLAETEDEAAFCERQYGLRPLDYLEKVHWLADDVWLAHGIHFNDDEIRRLGAARTGVTHCPSSNMVLGSGICRTLELERSGVPVGLAVDGSASNDGSNMMQEVRQALLIQRLRYGSDKVTHYDALRWATEGSAQCLGRSDIGAIHVGKQADLALFRLDELRFSGHGDPLAALLLCGSHNADRVMVAGEWRVVDGAVLNVDVAELIRTHQYLAAELQNSVH